MGRLLDSAIYAVGLAVIAYVACCVPLGQRTLLEHVMRIVQTEPARELRDGAVETAHRTRAQMEQALENHAREAVRANSPEPAQQAPQR